MKILRFIGAALYAALLSYLLYLLLRLITPWFMEQAGWFVIFTWVVIIPFLGYAMVAFAGLIISLPLQTISKDVEKAKIIPVICFIVMGLLSASLPWTLDMEYTTLTVVKAVTMSIFAVGLYLGLIFMTFAGED